MVAQLSHTAQLNQLERQLKPLTFWSFFPTPPHVIQRLLAHAALRDGMRVLEPTAGKGHICKPLVADADITLDVVEIIPMFRQLLSLYGFNVIGENIMQQPIQPIYDRVVANPPFDKQMRHIMRYYQFLKPGGRLVTVANALYRTGDSSSLYDEFRSWLLTVPFEDYPLPPHSFRNSERSTDVETCILVLDKPF
jgi:cyclopropane fatty-acyl-phospholipid synthase-like methyltransferase